MIVVRRLLTVVLIAVLAACASNNPNKPQRAKQLGYKQTFPFDPNRAPALDGVWSNTAYGLTLTFDGPAFEIYNRVSRFCWPERVPELRRAYLDTLTESSLFSDKSSVKFRREKGENELEFRPVADLPKDCVKEKTRLDVFDVFVDTMRQTYPHFERRGVMWTRTTADLRRGLKSIGSDEELLELITKATAGIGDPNLRIHGPGFVWSGEGSQSRQVDMLKVAFNRQDVITDFQNYRERWYEAIQSQIPGRLLGESATTRLNGNLIYGRMNGNIGYVYVADTTGTSADEWRDELELALSTLTGASSLVIDVSMVAGGNPRVMTDFAAMLVPRKTPLYLGKVNRIEDQRWGLAEAKERQVIKNKPVYIVTTEHTSGAGELLPLILRGLPGVRLIGETTRGALAQPWQKSLPNGWVVDLPIVIIADRKEAVFDGIGINPDFALELFSESQLTDAHWQGIVTLSALIQEGHFDRTGG